MGGIPRALTKKAFLSLWKLRLLLSRAFRFSLSRRDNWQATIFEKQDAPQTSARARLHRDRFFGVVFVFVFRDDDVGRQSAVHHDFFNLVLHDGNLRGKTERVVD